METVTGYLMILFKIKVITNNWMIIILNKRWEQKACCYSFHAKATGTTAEENFKRLKDLVRDSKTPYTFCPNSSMCTKILKHNNTVNSSLWETYQECLMQPYLLIWYMWGFREIDFWCWPVIVSAVWQYDSMNVSKSTDPLLGFRKCHFFTSHGWQWWDRKEKVRNCSQWQVCCGLLLLNIWDLFTCEIRDLICQRHQSLIACCRKSHSENTFFFFF